MQDIADDIGQERIHRVVDRFYDRIQQHPLLSQPFARVDDWPEHKAILTHFWWVTLGGKRYLNHPYAVARKHEEAGFTPALLQEWLTLFRATVQEEVPATLAAGWIERAERIGESLTYMHESAQRGHAGASNPSLFKPA